MKKLPLITLAALTVVGFGIAAGPASAESIASCRDDVTQSNNTSDGFEYQSRIDMNATNILQGLREKGVNAQSVSDWGGCVQAEVTTHHGTTKFEYFDPDTLQRLTRG